MNHKNFITTAINRTILAFLLLFTSNFAFAVPEDDFVSTWLITIAAGNNSRSITLPISSVSSTFNVTIDWGDDTATTTHTGTDAPTHVYSGTPGPATHSIRISGTFDRIQTTGRSLQEITQWGTTTWRTMESAFQGVEDLRIPTTAGAPNLSMVTDMSAMFGNSSFNSDINHWNVSSVTDMEDMFRSARFFNQSLNNWDVASVTNMNRMFFSAGNFDGDISNWDVSSVTNMGDMFDNALVFNQNISNWNVSEATNMFEMFLNAKAFNQNIGNWNVSKVTNMQEMFQAAAAFNRDISNWDVSKVTNMVNMFASANTFNQNLGNWYIVPSSTTINNAGGQTLIISGQNSILNTTSASHHKPSYTLSNTSTNNDNDKFNLTAAGTLTLDTPDHALATYKVSIISSKGFLKFNNAYTGTNQVTLTLITIPTLRPTITISTSSVTLEAGVEITPITLALGGGAVARYTISPHAFSSGGLSFDTNTGSISGMPAVAVIRKTYTITATNAVGSATVRVVITISIRDHDNDGIFDGYETDNDLNPNDASDADGDLDGDGVSNLEEYLANPQTQANIDDYPPVFGTITTALLTATVERSAFTFGADDDIRITATDFKDGNITPTLILVNDSTNTTTIGNQLILGSGVHYLVWQATDAAINTATATQRVEVTPLVGFDQSRQSGEAGIFTITAHLSGNAVTYPVTITFNGGAITFSSGTSATTTLDIAVSRTLVITSSTNAATSTNYNHTQQVINIGVPQLQIQSFDVRQGTSRGRIVAATNSVNGTTNVIITADISSARDATLTYLWRNGDNTSTNTILTIAQASLTVGFIDISLVVNSVSPTAITTRTLGLTVTTATIRLDENNNGIADTQERAAVNRLLPDTQLLANNGRIISISTGKIRTGVLMADSAEVSIDTLEDYAQRYDRYYQEDNLFANEIYDYSIEGIDTIGGTVSVVIALETAITGNTKVRKYNPTSNKWSDFDTDNGNGYSTTKVTQGASCPNAADISWGTLTMGDNCLQLVIRDGGSNDSDAIENGAIDDPIALSAPVISNSNGNSSGGCTLNNSNNKTAIDPIFYLLLILAFIGLRSRKQAIQVTGNR